MGRSRIEIETVGNHGCDRDAKPGDPLKPFCENPGCIDCRVGEAVAKVVTATPGAFDYDGCGAKMTHWPNSKSSTGIVSGEVVDDLVLRRRRHGSF